MLCVPAVSVEMGQLAEPEVTGTAVHSAIGLGVADSSVKVMVPLTATPGGLVGPELGVTVAENVTNWLRPAGVTLVERNVVVLLAVSVCAAPVDEVLELPEL